MTAVRPRRRTSAALLIAAVLAATALAVLGSLAGPVARAAASTWHDRWDYLHFPALRADAHCVAARRIHLAAGRYHWRVFTAHWAHTNDTNWDARTLTLRAGWYRWTDCLSPWDGSYWHQSELDEEATSGGPAVLHQLETGAYGDGTYHWGSALDLVG